MVASSIFVKVNQGSKRHVLDTKLWKVHFTFSQLVVTADKDKKVLLRERKRHTARRVAIAISCYSGGVPRQKFFPSLNMYQAKSGVKNFSLYWGGGGGGGWGSLGKKFFPQSEHVSSQIWCQKFFPLLGGEGGGSPLAKNFFPSLNMYQAKYGVKNFSLY